MQMISSVGTLKKTIADLQLKQWQKLPTVVNADESPLSNGELRGSAVLQQLMSVPREQLQQPTATDINNLPTMEEIDNDESLVSVDVKNEGKNVQLAILYDSETSNTIPIAMNDSGEIIDDYNIPSYMNDVDLYLTEGIARSKLGHTFPLIIR